MKKLNLYLFLIILSLTKQFLFGQESDDKIKLSLDELLQLDVKVEVASYFQEDNLNVSNTVELKTREDWQYTSSLNITDVFNQSSSIIALPTVSSAYALAIRGYANNLSTRGVAGILDGVPLNNFTFGSFMTDKGNIALGVLDRVEIIKGPGSALYGRDAFHGVSSFKTFYSSENMIEGEALFSSNNVFQHNLRVSRDLGKWGYLNFAGSLDYQGDQNITFDYSDPFTSQPESGVYKQNRSNTMVVAKWHNGEKENWKYHLNIYFDKEKASDWPGRGTHFNNGLSLAQEKDSSDRDGQYCMLKLGFEREVPFDIHLGLDGFYWLGWSEAGNNFQLHPAPYDHLVGYNKENLFGLNLFAYQDKKFQGWQWYVKYTYDHAKLLEGKQSFLFDDPNVDDLKFEATYANPSRYVHSLAAQIKGFFWNNLISMLYGARIDFYELGSDKFSHRAGLIYQPSHHWSFKALYGTSFRAPTAAEINGLGSLRGDANLKSEELTTYELIGIYQRQNFVGNITFFKNDWEDGIILTPVSGDPDFSDEYVNRGVNKSIGAEASAKISFAKWWIHFSGSYVDSHNEFDDFDYVAFPKWIFNLEINKKWKIYDGELNTRISYRGHYDAKEGKVLPGIIDSPEDLPDYHRIDLSAAYSIRNYQIFLKIRNVLDRNNFYPAIWNNENGIPDYGITGSFGLKVKF